MRHVDLFSGIGGFALAARWAGYQTEVFCERDEFCRKVLAKHWPGVPVVGDIHNFDGRSHAGSDLLTAGIPCQPYSCAGKQLGDGDDRALWPEARRVVAEVRPSWIVVENVAGFIGMALDGVLADLEAQGYECGTVVLPACAVNAPHRRDRVWIVADSTCQLFDGCGDSRKRWRDEYSDSGKVVADPINGGRIGRSPEPGRGSEERIAAGGNGEVITYSTTSGLLPPAHAGIHRREEGARPRDAEPKRRGSDGKWRQPVAGLGGVADGLPAFVDGHFDAEPDIPRVASGIPNRAARLKALGNAIVPQVAYQILQAIEAVKPET